MVIIDNWTSEWTYAVCSNQEDALRYAKTFVDGQATENKVRWGVRIEFEDGEQKVLSEGERAGRWVRIRHSTYETAELDRGRKWGEYDLPLSDDPPWPAKIAISIIGFIVLRWVTDAALVGTDLSWLIIPAHIVYVVWLISVWTGGGRLKKDV